MHKEGIIKYGGLSRLRRKILFSDSHLAANIMTIYQFKILNIILKFEYLNFENEIIQNIRSVMQSCNNNKKRKKKLTYGQVLIV